MCSLRSILIAIIGLSVSASWLAMLVWPCQAPGQTTAASSPSQPPSKKPVDAAQIERLIRQLGSERFTERESASRALDAIGEIALPALWKAQDSSDLEIRRRAVQLIEKITRRPVPMRAKAWAALKKAGGRIYSDTETPAGEVGSIEFVSTTKLHDEDLAWLPWLGEVKCLGFLDVPITDVGLVHLKHLGRLMVLDLQGDTKVTGAGLEHLKGLEQLYCLVLSGTRVTDVGLVHLKGLKGLRRLDLKCTQVTDAGLEHIKDIKGLEWLDLSHTQVTDAGLAKLKELKKLNFLNLSNTQVTDAGLTHLKEIRTLHMLSVDGTKVTERVKAEWLKKMEEWFKELERRAKPSGSNQNHGAK